MMPAPQRWSLRRTGLAAWLAVLLVLSGQFRAAAAQDDGAISAVQAATVFCHAGQDAGSKAPVLPHQAHEPAVLQAGLAGPQALAITPAPPWLAQPCVTRGGARVALPARAPPGRFAAAAFPRGPPRRV